MNKKKTNNKGNDNNTANVETRHSAPTWASVKADGARWCLTLFPVARKTKEGKKGANIAETFAPFLITTAGAKEKHPLTSFQFLNVPNGRRENMIVWACEFAKEHALNIRPWIVDERNGARDKIVARLRKANEKTEKTIAEGARAYKTKAGARAEKTFETLAEKIDERNAEIARLMKK